MQKSIRVLAVIVECITGASSVLFVWLLIDFFTPPLHPAAVLPTLLLMALALLTILLSAVGVYWLDKSEPAPLPEK